MHPYSIVLNYTVIGFEDYINTGNIDNLYHCYITLMRSKEMKTLYSNFT